MKNYKDKKILELREESDRKTVMLDKAIQEIIRLNSIIRKKR